MIDNPDLQNPFSNYGHGTDLLPQGGEQMQPDEIPPIIKRYYERYKADKRVFWDSLWLNNPLDMDFLTYSVKKSVKDSEGVSHQTWIATDDDSYEEFPSPETIIEDFNSEYGGGEYRIYDTASKRRICRFIIPGVPKHPQFDEEKYKLKREFERKRLDLERKWFAKEQAKELEELEKQYNLKTTQKGDDTDQQKPGKRPIDPITDSDNGSLQELITRALSNAVQPIIHTVNTLESKVQSLTNSTQQQNINPRSTQLTQTQLSDGSSVVLSGEIGLMLALMDKLGSLSARPPVEQSSDMIEKRELKNKLKEKKKLLRLELELERLRAETQPGGNSGTGGSGVKTARTAIDEAFSLMDYIKEQSGLKSAETTETDKIIHFGEGVLKQIDSYAQMYLQKKEESRITPQSSQQLPSGPSMPGFGMGNSVSNLGSNPNYSNYDGDIVMSNDTDETGEDISYLASSLMTASNVTEYLLYVNILNQQLITNKIQKFLKKVKMGASLSQSEEDFLALLELAVNSGPRDAVNIIISEIKAVSHNLTIQYKQQLSGMIQAGIPKAQIDAKQRDYQNHLDDINTLLRTFLSKVKDIWSWIEPDCRAYLTSNPQSMPEPSVPRPQPTSQTRSFGAGSNSAPISAVSDHISNTLPPTNYIPHTPGKVSSQELTPPINHGLTPQSNSNSDSLEFNRGSNTTQNIIGISPDTNLDYVRNPPPIMPSNSNSNPISEHEIELQPDVQSPQPKIPSIKERLAALNRTNKDQ